MHSSRFPWVAGLVAIAACGKTKSADLTPAATATPSPSTTRGSATPGTGSAAAAGAATYFELAVDGGKPMTIAAEDISSRFTNLNNHPRFTIYAGGSDLPRVMLTVPNAMTGPSSTPSGSATIEDISQGSVSLQNFPEKGDTTNSFDSLHGPEAAVVQPDAITITAITPADKDAKYVEGTFHVKTFGLGHPGDAKITDHLVQGRFRIMFAYDPGQGF